MNDSNEEQEEDKDLLLACILVGEYLEEKEEWPKSYARERIAWEQHFSKLAAEGNETFQQLYRMVNKGCVLSSIQKTVLKMKLDISHLILVKLLLQ